MNASQLTEQILVFWQKTDAFRESIRLRSEKLSYTFYDGPPFTSGDPHYGHLLQSVVKDMVPRWMTMRGYRVARKWGWDCHGIPAENFVNKQLGITSKKQVEEEFGLQNYIEACRSMVNQVNDNWKWTIDRLGRWVDMDNAYFTMDNEFMESVISLFSDLYHRNLIYKGFKVLGYSRALGTALSNSEIAEAYEMRQDPAVTVKFRVKNADSMIGKEKQEVHKTHIAFSEDEQAIEVVVGVIKDSSGRMLMLYKNKHNMWYCPGGKIHAGEPAVDALHREMQEELGVEVISEKFLGHTKTVHRGRLYRVHYFLVDIEETPTIQLPQYHGMLEWIEKIPSENEFGYVLKFDQTIIADAEQLRHDFADIHVLEQGLLSEQQSGDAGVFLLPWTTTPWTLPANMFAAVHRDIDYMQIFDKKAQEYYVLAKACLPKYYHTADEYIEVMQVKGSELVGVGYEPLYSYYYDTGRFGSEYTEQVHRVLHADFVTTESGTGIVHEAPAFGADDYDLVASVLGRDNAQAWLFDPVNEYGEFTTAAPDFVGKNVIEANSDIVKDLKTRGLLIKHETYNHSYPHCPRTKTPLIYKAIESWFVKEDDLKAVTVPAAEQITFVPSTVKQRFINGLASAPDRNISRTRFRGAPLPVWTSKDGLVTKVVGNLEEIYQLNKPTKQLTKLILIRHGRTDYNEKRILDCMDKARLSVHGQQQAEELIQKLAGVHVDAVYMSPLTRCVQTITPWCTHHGVEACIDERLRECDMPGLQDKGYDDFLQDYTGGAPVDGGSGESLQALDARMGAFLCDIAQKHAGQTVVICSHSDPLQFVRKNIWGFDYDKDFDKHYPENATPMIEYIRSDTGKGLDLHRPYIDHVTLIDPETKKELYRIPEVLDCWFESGAMPYGQDHFLGGVKVDMKNDIVILVDAAKGVIACDDVYSIETFTLNKELADNLAILPYRKIVVTNTSGAKRQKMEELLRGYDFEFFSLENNPNKSDPLYFATLLKRFQLSADQIIYFDHQIEALDSARQQGIKHTFQSANNEQIITQLNNIIGSQVGSLKSEVSFTNCADFIAEGLDQTRGWFRALHVLGHAYHGQNVFRNVVVTGLILAEDGKKMSKSLQNYPDPNHLLNQYGADALRLYLLGSPVVRAEPLRFSEKGVEQMMKDVVIPLQNVCNFFKMYAEVDQWKDTGTQVWFLRHALKQSKKSGDENADYENEADRVLPLSDAGEAQLQTQAFIETILRINPDVIVCSEFVRTAKTAQKALEILETYTGKQPELVYTTDRGLGMMPADEFAQYNDPEENDEYAPDAKGADVVYADLLKQYPGKRILVVSHKRRFRYLWQWLGKLEVDMHSMDATKKYMIPFESPVALPLTQITNELDQWVLAELHRTTQQVTAALEAYTLEEATQQLISFVEKITNRYLRRSRRRFWAEEMTDDKQQAYQTLFTVIRTYLQLCAPFIPFVTEHLRQELLQFTDMKTDHPSIHLQARPLASSLYINDELIDEIETVRKVIKGALYLRAKHQVKVKQPLPSLQFKI